MTNYKLSHFFDKNVEIPVVHTGNRRLSIDEIKEFIMEEFGKAKDVSKLKVKELPWSDAELEHQINFMKALKIDELLIKKQEK